MGKWMMLEGRDLEMLYEEVGLDAKVEEKKGRAQREKKLRPLETTESKARQKSSNKPKSSRGGAGRLRGR
jgi:hypothetical protein